MITQAQFHFHRQMGTPRINVGESDVEVISGPGLMLHCHVKFTYLGKEETGLVTEIYPDDWAAGVMIPRIVVASPGS